MRASTRAIAAALFSVATAPMLARAQASGGVSPSESRLRLLRSTSGSKGSVQGSRYVIEDPRTVFHVPEDRTVVVYFEWQAPPGLHKCDGVWKDPSGKAVLTSSSEYLARGPRFGLYWTLSLPETVATGRWTLEAHVDGEAAGSHAFELRLGPGNPVVPTRRPLVPAEAYRRGLQLTYGVEALDENGKRSNLGSGFLLAKGVVLTAFETINAARRIRVVRPDGSQVESTSLVSWDRARGWAAVAVPDFGQAPAVTVPGLEVGDRCYFLDAQDDGSRAIVETSVVGEMKNGRLSLAHSGSEASAGAPVLNDYGDVAGMIGGSGLLGANLLDLGGLGRAGIPASGVLAMKHVAVPAAASPTPLASIDPREFVRPLAATPHFVSGVLGRSVERRGPIPMAMNQGFQFSRADGEIFAFVTWGGRQKEDAVVRFQLFGAETNERLGESPPAKARLRTGETFVQSWKINVGSLRSGIYRVDVLLGENPVLRLFFRVAD